jgi:hypothetical protein
LHLSSVSQGPNNRTDFEHAASDEKEKRPLARPVEIKSRTSIEPCGFYYLSPVAIS